MANGDISCALTISGTTSNGETIKGLTNTKTYSSIAGVYERTLSVDTTARTVIVIDATNVDGDALAALNFFAVKNTHASVAIRVGLVSATDTVFIQVDAGESFILGSDQIDANVTGAAYSAMVAITSITLTAASGSVVAGVIAF